MKIRKNILFRYYLRETKFCLTAINFSIRKCVNRNNSEQPLNASTYNNDKGGDRLKEKAVQSRESDFEDNGESKLKLGVTAHGWQTKRTKNEDRVFRTKFFYIEGANHERQHHGKKIVARQHEKQQNI